MVVATLETEHKKRKRVTVSTHSPERIHWSNDHKPICIKLQPNSCPPELFLSRGSDDQADPATSWNRNLGKSLRGPLGRFAPVTVPAPQYDLRWENPYKEETFFFFSQESTNYLSLICLKRKLFNQFVCIQQRKAAWSKTEERKTSTGCLHRAGGREAQARVFLKQPNNRLVCIALFKPLVFQTFRPRKKSSVCIPSDHISWVLTYDLEPN